MVNENCCRWKADIRLPSRVVKLGSVGLPRTLTLASLDVAQRRRQRGLRGSRLRRLFLLLGAGFRLRLNLFVGGHLPILQRLEQQGRL